MPKRTEEQQLVQVSFPPKSDREGFLWAAGLLAEVMQVGRLTSTEALALGYLTGLAARSIPELEDEGGI